MFKHAGVLYANIKQTLHYNIDFINELPHQTKKKSINNSHIFRQPVFILKP